MAAAALQTLATYRARHARASQDVFEKGFHVLEQRSLQKLGDEAWPFLEQFALAALDIGRTDVADDCIRELADQFPDSPRVDILRGIRMEATEPPETCLKYYEQIQDAEAPNATIWKRRISVLRRTGQTAQAVAELCQLLDTFYNDAEGWVELADLYAGCGQYTAALQSLSHALLLAPQNAFYALQFAETAHSAGDVPLALRTALVVVDMCDRDQAGAGGGGGGGGGAVKDSVPAGLAVRAWWAVKLCARQLLAARNARAAKSSPGPKSTSTSTSSHSNKPASAALASASDTPVPADLELIDRLATERVLTAYSAPERGRAPAGREVVLSFMKGA
ncbi:hypothetical protein HDZ31DRAFT_60474 [Schizophyllum fasciatum]